MIRALANWAAKQYYIFNQEFQATTAELHTGLSLRLAGEKRALIAQLNKEADDIEANIKSVDERLSVGYWECARGHEKADAFIPEAEQIAESKRAQTKAEEENVTGSEKAANTSRTGPRKSGQLLKKYGAYKGRIN